MNRNRGQNPIPNPVRSLKPVPGMCFPLVSFHTSLTQLWLPPCCLCGPISCPHGAHVHTPVWYMTIPRIGWIWQESACGTDLAIFAITFVWYHLAQFETPISATKPKKSGCIRTCYLTYTALTVQQDIINQQINYSRSTSFKGTSATLLSCSKSRKGRYNISPKTAGISPPSYNFQLAPTTSN